MTSVEQLATDPVCGMSVSLEAAGDSVEWNGSTYHFCERVCREIFEEDPERWTTEDRDPIPIG